MAPAHHVRFGPFELDGRTNELRKSGRRVRVHDQPLQILRALLDRAGDVVTREELRARLWPADTFVDFDHGVNSAVRRLRDALGDTADRPKYIETLPRRGYRFIGTIEVDDAAATAPALVDSSAAKPPAASALATETPPAATRVVASAARPWSRRWLVAAATLLALSALAFVAPWSDRRRSPATSWHEATRLTFDDGLQTDPSFSPDGASIAYAGDAAGAFDIWTQRIAANGSRVGAPMRVTTHPADDSQPDWSPDGNSIVFRSERGAGGIFVAPATGGVDVQVADFGYRPQWSPDGRLIVFASSLVAGLNGVLHVVDPNGRTPRPLRAPGVSGGGFGWRPGSHEVVILNAFRVPFNIVLVSVDVETSESVRWTFDEPVIDGFREQTLIVPGERLRWSEDGRTMYFVGESRGLRSLWRVEVDAAAHRVVGGPFRVTSTARDANNFAVSRDGRHIAFDGSTRAARLWAYELDGAGGLREGREQPVSLEAAHAEGPDLSPDGLSLVSMQSQPGSRQRLEIVARDMATGRDRVLRTVDDDRENVAFVRWSGHGTRLSYLHTVRSAATGSRDQVRLLDPATDHDEALTSQRTARSAMADLAGDWTFDDTAIVASSKRYVDGHDAIVLLPLAGAPHAETSAVIVTSVSQGGIFQVSASPDGRWITFRAAGAPGLPGARIAVVSASARGSDEASWIIAAGTERWSVDKPRWSTSSDRIYFTGTDGGPLGVWSIGFDSARGVVTGPPRQALALNSPDAYLLPDIRELELAVGGNRLVVPIVRPTGGIWIAERER